MQETPDPSSILGSGSSPAEGIGYPLQYSWASLMAQMVKNLPAMRDTWVWSLVGKVPWRRAWQPIPVFWPGESPCTEMPGRLQSMELQRVGHDWATKHIQNDKNLKEQQYYELMRKWIDWNFHTPPVTMQNGAAALENSLAISQKIKHKLTILSRNSTPRIWLKINGKKMSTQWLAHRCL